MEATDSQIKSFLEPSKTIAIVGASSKPERTSNEISQILKEKGHKLVPIHPKEEIVLGDKVIQSLDDLEQSVDGVIFYLNPKILPDQLEVAIQKEIPFIWLPLDIYLPDEFKPKLEEKNITYVQNKCPKIEWPKHFS